MTNCTFKQNYTMIQWMALVFSMAVLAAGALPIYRSIMLRAHETAMVQSMSHVQQAQEKYRAEFGQYAGGPGMQSVIESLNNQIKTDNFPESGLLDYENLLISINHPENDEFLLIWILDETEFMGKEIPGMAMDHEGNLFQPQDKGLGNDWLPDFPHLQKD